MPNTKLLRGNYTIAVAYPEAFANFETPTAAELNDATMVFNISGAVDDSSHELALTSSDTDDSISIVDISQVSTPTLTNYTATISVFRDADDTASGVFNEAYRLFKAKGVPLVLIKRIGAANDAAFAVGNIVSMFLVKTDNPSDSVERGAPIRLDARFKPQGAVISEYEVAS